MPRRREATMGETPDEEFERKATERERETCPKCGIARYWLERAHPSNRPLLDRCGHPFHKREGVA
jgi:hypothetical protein